MTEHAIGTVLAHRADAVVVVATHQLRMTSTTTDVALPAVTALVGMTTAAGLPRPATSTKTAGTGMLIGAARLMSTARPDLATPTTAMMLAAPHLAAATRSPMPTATHARTKHAHRRLLAVARAAQHAQGMRSHTRLVPVIGK